MDADVALSEVDSLDGIEFEEFLVEVLEELGYEAEATRATGDYGCDIIAEKDTVRWAIQAKRYSGSVGVDAVQQILMGRSYYDADKAWIITNSSLTEQARQAANKLRVRVTERDELARMVEDSGLARVNVPVITSKETTLMGQVLEGVSAPPIDPERCKQIEERIGDIRQFFDVIHRAYDNQRRNQEHGPAVSYLGYAQLGCFDSKTQEMRANETVYSDNQEFQVRVFLEDYSRDPILDFLSDAMDIVQPFLESDWLKDHLNEEGLTECERAYVQAIDSLKQSQHLAQRKRMQNFFKLLEACVWSPTLQGERWFREEKPFWSGRQLFDFHPELKARANLYKWYDRSDDDYYLFQYERESKSMLLEEVSEIRALFFGPKEIRELGKDGNSIDDVFDNHWDEVISVYEQTVTGFSRA